MIIFRWLIKLLYVNTQAKPRLSGETSTSWIDIFLKLHFDCSSNVQYICIEVPYLRMTHASVYFFSAVLLKFHVWRTLADRCRPPLHPVHPQHDTHAHLNHEAHLLTENRVSSQSSSTNVRLKLDVSILSDKSHKNWCIPHILELTISTSIRKR